MNRDFFTLLFLCIVLMLSTVSIETSGQHKDSIPLMSPQDVEHYISQSEQLVRFMEFSFNTVGNSNTSAREKDVIINQSYLKFFSSGKVQIEDDLVEGRFTVTNKDVQAYLKDIDFFFKHVVFTFTIENISYNVNDNGQVYFIATTTRNLNGITSEEDTIYNNQTRYIEINLDREKRDLKIASIYTSKLSEKEDMRNWWSGLSAEWRLHFAKTTLISNEYPLKDILDFSEKWILIERHQVSTIESFTMESYRTDTLHTNPKQIYQEINRIWKTESIDISSSPSFSDIAPLVKLTELRTININGAPVDNLTPLRNLTRLENLDISGTYITQLDPLRHAINLRSLDVSRTQISNLSQMPAFPALEKLNLSNTKISNLDAISNLTSLRDLRLSNTRLSDISPLEKASNLIVLDISGTLVSNLNTISRLLALERLHADNTKITNLSPLSKHSNLQYIFIEGTNISDIQVLSGMPNLKRIYCDRTLIQRDKANRFMQDNPNVLVIYESQALTTWWAGLSQAWKNVFMKNFSVSELLTREELHEIANISHINISENKEIQSLSPLQHLPGLRSLQAANTNILSLEPLKENIDLTELDISSTNIQDISVLSGLRILETLKLSDTPVEDISALKSNSNLKYLDIDNTNVLSIEPLGSLTNLEVVFCDGIGADKEVISEIYEANPKVTVVFQTKVLNNWWNNLPDVWITIIEQHILLDSPPTRIQLQKIVDLRELNISNIRGIQNIETLKQFHLLQILKMNDVQISDISSLEHLKNLSELYCSNNPLSDLKPLENLQNLTILDCSNTLVRNLDELKNLPNLRTLNISGTQVRRLRPLSNLKSLRNIDCSNTKIISLQPLESLKELEVLRCNNTNIWKIFVNRFKKAVPACEVVHF